LKKLNKLLRLSSLLLNAWAGLPTTLFFFIGKPERHRACGRVPRRNSLKS